MSAQPASARREPRSAAVALLIPSREAEKAHLVTPSSPQSPARDRARRRRRRRARRRPSGVRTLLDDAGISRSLLRIAHEIVERTEEPERLYLVAIPNGGIPLARQLARELREVADLSVPVGILDTTLYRDDLLTTGNAARAAPHRDAVGGRRPHRRARRRRGEDRAHDPRRDGRADGLRPARARCRWWGSSTAATASCRSSSTTSARTCRRARASRCSCATLDGRRGRARARDHRRARRRRRRTRRASRDRARPARHRGPRPQRDRAHPRHRRAHARDRRARGEEGPDAARPHDHQPVLRVVDAHARELRDRRQAALGRRDQLLAVELEH